MNKELEKKSTVDTIMSNPKNISIIKEVLEIIELYENDKHILFKKDFSEKIKTLLFKINRNPKSKIFSDVSQRLEKILDSSSTVQEAVEKKNKLLRLINSLEKGVSSIELNNPSSLEKGVSSESNKPSLEKGVSSIKSNKTSSLQNMLDLGFLNDSRCNYSDWTNDKYINYKIEKGVSSIELNNPSSLEKGVSSESNKPSLEKGVSSIKSNKTSSLQNMLDLGFLNDSHCNYSDWTDDKYINYKIEKGVSSTEQNKSDSLDNKKN